MIFSQATKSLKMFYFTHRLGEYSKSKITPLHLLHEHLTKKFTPVALTDIKQKKNFHKMFVESCDVLYMFDHKVLKLDETEISFAFSFRWTRTFQR